MSVHEVLPSRRPARRARTLPRLAAPETVARRSPTIYCGVTDNVAESIADAAIRGRFATLLPVEREVVAMLVDGDSGEDVARRLGIPELAAEFYRARVFCKLGADSIIDLLVMARICGVG